MTDFIRETGASEGFSANAPANFAAAAGVQAALDQFGEEVRAQAAALLAGILRQEMRRFQRDLNGQLAAILAGAVSVIGRGGPGVAGTPPYAPSAYSAGEPEVTHSSSGAGYVSALQSAADILKMLERARRNV